MRRGYSASDLVAQLPGNMKAGLFFCWNEPFYRLLYVPLKVLHLVLSNWTPCFVRCIAAVDARCRRKGTSGHLFVCVVKSGGGKA